MFRWGQMGAPRITKECCLAAVLYQPCHSHQNSTWLFSEVRQRQAWVSFPGAPVVLSSIDRPQVYLRIWPGAMEESSTLTGVRQLCNEGHGGYGMGRSQMGVTLRIQKAYSTYRRGVGGWVACGNKGEETEAIMQPWGKVEKRHHSEVWAPRGTTSEDPDFAPP